MSTFHIHLFSHVFGRLENMTLMSKPLTGIYFNRFNYQLAGPSCRDDTRPYTPLGEGEGERAGVSRLDLETNKNDTLLLSKN